MPWTNLDRECSVIAGLVAKGPLGKTSVKIVTEGGSVLAAQGPYAFALYLQWKKLDPAAAGLIAHCGAFVSTHVDQQPLRDVTPEQFLALIRRLSTDLEKLLLAKTLLTQILAYLKYEIKGRT